MIVPQVEKPIDELRPAGEMLGHVVEPVCVDFGDQPRFLPHLQGHPERVEPGRVVQLLCVVKQGKQLHPCRCDGGNNSQTATGCQFIVPVQVVTLCRITYEPARLISHCCCWEFSPCSPHPRKLGRTSCRTLDFFLEN